MANPEHVKLVKEGSVAIEAWRAINLNDTLDLRDAGLRFADLRNADLRKSDLRNANLQFNDLTRTLLTNANLKQANLRHSVLTSVDLSGSCLREANLSGADLRGVNLTGADLSHANLKSAQLNGAVLSQTNLQLADLSTADLSSASFRSACLTDAKFASAKIHGTVLADINLSTVKGIHSVEHLGPSILSTSTLERSQGTIPDVFLRGCGVSDTLIEFAPSIFGSPFEFYSCFISYSHADKQFARQLHDRLQGKGIRCWLDEHELKPGDNIYKSVDHGIRLWDKVLLCCSEASLNSWWVGREIETAIEREQQFHKEHEKEILKIIPLNLDGSLFEWDGEHAAVIRKRLAADFRNWKRNADKFEEQFEKVVKALRASKGPPEPEPKLGRE